jgi:hypothetical protein
LVLVVSSRGVCSLEDVTSVTSASTDGNTACTDTVAKKVEILEEVFGSTCANGVHMSDFMDNENHVVAEGGAEYWALSLTDDTEVFSIFSGAEYWAGKIQDAKESCGLPGDTKFQINDGSSSSTDSVINAYADSGFPQCADNPIGELVYAYFLEWCTAESITCTQVEQFMVWMRARELGWCGAFLEVYGKSWGEYVCAMEAANAYNSNPSCIATDVPCIACSGDGCEGESISSNSRAGKPQIEMTLAFAVLAYLALFGQ